METSSVKNLEILVDPHSLQGKRGGEGLPQQTSNKVVIFLRLLLNLIWPFWVARVLHMTGFKVFHKQLKSGLGSPFQVLRIKIELFFVVITVLVFTLASYLHMGDWKLSNLPFYFSFHSLWICIILPALLYRRLYQTGHLQKFSERVKLPVVVLSFFAMILLLSVGLGALEIKQIVIGSVKVSGSAKEGFVLVTFGIMLNMILNIWSEVRVTLPDRTLMSLKDFHKQQRLSWIDCKFSSSDSLVLGAFGRSYHEVDWYSARAKKHFVIHGDKETGADDYITSYLPWSASQYFLDGQAAAVLIFCDASRRSGLEFSPFYRYDIFALDRYLARVNKTRQTFDAEAEVGLQQLPPATGLVVADSGPRINKVMSLLNLEFQRRFKQRANPQDRRSHVRIVAFFDEDATLDLIMHAGRNESLTGVKIKRLLEDGKSYNIHFFFRMPVFQRPQTIPKELLGFLDDILFWYRFRFKVTKKRYEATGSMEEIEESPVSYHNGEKIGKTLDAFARYNGKEFLRCKAPYISGEEAAFQIQSTFKNYHPAAREIWQILFEHEKHEMERKMREKDLEKASWVWTPEGGQRVTIEHPKTTEHLDEVDV